MIEKGIHWESDKRILKFYHTTKLFEHKPESVQENETHKILMNFELHMNHPLPLITRVN